MGATIGDIFELQVIGNCGGQYVENVLHFLGAQTNSTTPGTDANQVINDFIATVQGPYLACMANDYILGGYKCRRVNNTGGPGASQVNGGIGTRTKASQVQSSGAVITGDWYDPTHINKAPKGPGKWSVSKIFMPGAAQGDIVDGAVQAGYATALGTFIGALSAGIGSGPVGPETYIVWSRKQMTGYTVTGLEVALLTGTQRKRLRPVI